MINPKIMKTRSMKFISRARGEKLYRAGFQFGSIEHFSRRQFRTATEADDYGVRLKMRWIRLYDAALAQIVLEPTA